MNLFIDTNIYLTFYHFTSDDLEELKKLSVAIKSGKIRLFIPSQILHEFRRNRESKIADALKMVDSQKLGNQFPQMFKQYPEYKDLVNSIKTFEQSKDTILKQLEDEIENNSLRADEVIADLFKKAIEIPIKEDLIVMAKQRHDLGN